MNYYYYRPIRKDFVRYRQLRTNAIASVRFKEIVLVCKNFLFYLHDECSPDDLV